MGLRNVDIRVSAGEVNRLKAMIGAPDLSLCGFSENPFISGHLDNFMRIVIERLDMAQQ